MLHWWSDFRSRFNLVSPREAIIWNNHNIRVNGKPIFYNKSRGFTKLKSKFFTDDVGNKKGLLINKLLDL